MRQGHLIKTPRGYSAFEPSKLPISLKIDNELLQLAGQADWCLGGLSSLEKVIPNTTLLLRPYAVKEALVSSEIEGTQSTLSDVLAEEKEISDNIDIREVQNYEKAINAGIHSIIKDNIPITLRLLKELHSILLKDVRGGETEKTPGEFRRSQNWIGGKNISSAVFVPPSPETLMQHLYNLEDYINSRDLPPIIKAALIHYQFETIHPFIDGNGRIGRILVTLYLMQESLLQSPILYLSLYFKENKIQYYDLLTNVRTTGNYENWVKFFLKGVIEVCEEVKEKTNYILYLMKNYKDNYKDPYGFIDFIFTKPVFKVQDVATALKVSLKTAYHIVYQFEKEKVIVTKNDNKRNKRYQFKLYIALLSETKLKSLVYTQKS